jgi:hypothetical protein
VSTDPLLPGLRTVSVPLLFVHERVFADRFAEMPNDNPFVCVVQRSAQSNVVWPTGEKRAEWARTRWVGPAVKWQCIAITLSALRTHSPIALSVLPLLKGICAMAFEVPRELSYAIGPNSVVPTIAMQRFMSTRFAQSVTGVAFGAAPHGASAASKKRPHP